jgi:hypothetical protein
MYYSPKTKLLLSTDRPTVGIDVHIAFILACETVEPAIAYTFSCIVSAMDASRIVCILRTCWSSVRQTYILWGPAAVVQHLNKQEQLSPPDTPFSAIVSYSAVYIGVSV